MTRWLIYLGAFLVVATAAPSAAQAWEPFRSRNGDVERGNELLKQDEPEGALDAYNKAARTLPGEPGIPLNRGLALLKGDSADEAKAAFMAAAAPSKTIDLRGPAYYNLGVTHARDGEAASEQQEHQAAAASFREAVAHFKRSLRAKPGDENAAWNLEYARKRLLEEEEAAKKQQEEQEQQQDEQQQNEQQDDEQSQQEPSEQDQEPQESGDEQDPQNEQQEQESSQDQESESEEEPSPNEDDAQQEQEQPQPEPQQQKAQQEPQQGNQEEPTQQPPPKAVPEHVQQMLDALDQNEESLPVQRARRRSRSRRAPDKDW